MNIFWVPPEARWAFLRGKAKQPEIGKRVDDVNTSQNPPLPADLRTR